MRLVLRLLLLAPIVAVLAIATPGPASAQVTAINSTAFPLPGNVLFPARTERKALRCQNPKTNDAATITYPSGFVMVLEPGGTLWETNIGVAVPNVGIGPNGAILSTGTAGQTLKCEDTYREHH